MLYVGRCDGSRRKVNRFKGERFPRVALIMCNVQCGWLDFNPHSFPLPLPFPPKDTKLDLYRLFLIRATDSGLCFSHACRCCCMTPLNENGDEVRPTSALLNLKVSMSISGFLVSNEISRHVNLLP